MCDVSWGNLRLKSMMPKASVYKNTVILASKLYFLEQFFFNCDTDFYC